MKFLKCILFIFVFISIGCSKLKSANVESLYDLADKGVGNRPILSVISPASGANVQKTFSISGECVRGAELILFAGALENPGSISCAPNGRYSYIVTVNSAAGSVALTLTQGLRSVSVTYSYEGPALPKPTAPNIISATALNSSQIKLIWSPSTVSSGSVISYQIFRGGSLQDTVASTQLEYTDSSLTPSTVYSYQLKAVTLAGQTSEFGLPMSATTLAVLSTKPTAPVITSATGLNSTQIRIIWNASTVESGSIASYQVFKAGNLLATVPSTQLNYTDSSLPPSTSYSYQVKALTQAGELSDLSPAVSATTLNAGGTFPVVGDFTSIPSEFNVSQWVGPRVEPECGPGYENSAKPDVVGAFRFLCTPSHNLYDDPIVYPGKPGAAHLHTFFGNTLANAHSTYESLRTTGNGTCDGGPLNRSAYWIPAMMNGQGKVVMPNLVSIYYKRRPKTDPVCQTQGVACVPLPKGLRVIFGYNMGLDMNDPTQAHPKWKCENGFAVNGQSQHSTIGATQCPSTTQIGSVLATPDCWDGLNLDSADHRTHMAYGGYDRMTGQYKCPSTHRYIVPQFTLSAWYSHEGPADLSNWYLSSDRMAGKPVLPNGSTFHSDWFGAWDDDIMDEWTSNAIDKLMNCSAGNMGSGRGLIRPPNFKWLASPRLVDPPPAPDMSSHSH